MYPEGTTHVYSNFTPRSGKHAPKGCDGLINFGEQAVFNWLHEEFKNNFFDKNKEEVIREIGTEFSMYTGTEFDTKHFEALHDLGFLPIHVKALPEGMLVPMGVTVLTITNTKSDFYWLTNYLETVISNMLWLPMTSATIAFQYKKLMTKNALETDRENIDGVNFQVHDFSMRGMGGLYSAILSGMAHAAVFNGSDNLPTIPALRKYYGADGFVIGGVPATEHSIMCAGTKEDELGTFKDLLDKYPKGILSVVSDTWDLWKVCTEYLPALKDQIMSREGKLVIRPDSGDPVDIICGRVVYSDKYEALDNHGVCGDSGRYFSQTDDYGYNGEIVGVIDDKEYSEVEQKGVIELLWNTFGGTINEQGYKVLDPHIGAIYGDSITLDRAEQICERLKAKGFASTNIVLGIGSYTYQYNTRDTFGFAVKATYVEIKGESREIFKDPITDDGIKKSAKGLLKVYRDEDGNVKLKDQCTKEEESEGLLRTVYINGNFENVLTLQEIRETIQENI